MISYDTKLINTKSEKIEQLAKNLASVDILKEDIDEFNLADISYFITLRSLCFNHRNGHIDIQQLTIEFKELKEQYMQLSLFIAIYEKHKAIEQSLCGLSKIVEKGNCEKCKRLLRIFDGRERWNGIA